MLCLNMIVKNEVHVIKRCLDSVRPFIDSWCIVDTGSTDDTIQVIKQELEALPGQLYELPWEGFGPSRTAALNLARRWGSHALVIDADEALRYEAGSKLPELDRSMFLLEVRRVQNNELSTKKTLRPAILDLSIAWKYVGWIHEQLICEPNVKVTSARLVGMDILTYADSARNQNPNKLKGDVALLERQLVDTPEDPATIMHLACGQCELGDYVAALTNFQKLVGKTDWKELNWFVQFKLATLKVVLGYPAKEVCAAFEAAVELDPTRAETYGQYARYLYTNGDTIEAQRAAFTGKQLPLTQHLFFVDEAYYGPQGLCAQLYAKFFKENVWSLSYSAF